LDGWISAGASAAFGLVFLPLARNRVPEDIFERLLASMGLFMLSGDGEVLSSLPRWYVAVLLAWALVTAILLLAPRPLGKGMNLLFCAGLVGMSSVVFWPDTWPADATLFRRIDVQLSVTLAIISAGVLIRRPARPAPDQPHPA
jgi:hypothetical protein